MATLYNDNADFQFKWNGANEDYAQIKARNDAKIAALEAELQQLEGKQANYLRDDDILDLELAENRARAFDMNGATTALSRIDSRTQNRIRDARTAALDKFNKAELKAAKRSELEKTIRETEIKRSQAGTKSDKDILDAQLVDLGNQLKANGGSYTPRKYEGIDRGDALKEYFANTVNKSTGRKFRDDVDPVKREEIVNNLIEVGEYEKAAEIEAMSTTAEKKAARAAYANKVVDIQRSVKGLKKVISDTKYVSSSEDPNYKNRQEALQKADSLARNYPTLVSFQNGELKFIGKDIKKD